MGASSNEDIATADLPDEGQHVWVSGGHLSQTLNTAQSVLNELFLRMVLVGGDHPSRMTYGWDAKGRARRRT